MVKISAREWLAVAVTLIIVLSLFFSFNPFASKNNNQNGSQPASVSEPSNGNQANNNAIGNSAGSVSDQLKIEDIAIGAGPTIGNGDKLSVHYVGTLANGAVFDSSIARGQPIVFTFGAGQVIKGWDLGLQGMRVGGKRRLTIPPALGYGSQAVGPIPANSTLIFEIQLLQIQK